MVDTQSGTFGSSPATLYRDMEINTILWYFIQINSDLQWQGRKTSCCRTPPARPFGEYLFYAEGVRYLHILSQLNIFVSHEVVLWIYAHYICISQSFIVELCTSSHVFDLHVILVSYWSCAWTFVLHLTYSIRTFYVSRLSSFLVFGTDSG